jgi:hypothetical protein
METDKKNVSDDRHAPAEEEHFLVPVASTDKLVRAMRTFEDVKTKMLTEQDKYALDDKSERIRKSGWRKLALAFGISDEVLHEERAVDDKDPAHVIVRFTVRAWARGGRSVVGVGSASSKERAFAHLEHDLRALAHTRAKSRAIADLLGSSDQVADEFEEQEPRQAPTPAARAAQSEGFKGGPQQKIDAGQRAIATNFLKDVLGEDLVGLIRLEEKEGELLVILPAPMREEDRTRFLKAMLVIGQGVHESAKGLVAHMKAPIAVERSRDGSRG